MLSTIVTKLEADGTPMRLIAWSFTLSVVECDAKHFCLTSYNDIFYSIKTGFSKLVVRCVFVAFLNLSVNFTYLFQFLDLSHACHIIEGGAWGMGVVKGWLFIIVFEFYVPKLVSVPIFSLIVSLFVFRGVGCGCGRSFVFFRIRDQDF